MSAFFKRLSNLSFLASSDSDSDDEDKENNIIGTRLETTSASEIAEELMSPETSGNKNLSSRVVLGEKQCVDGGNIYLENELISESSDEDNVELLPDDGPAVLVREDLADEEEDFDDHV
uniref:Uncharacterized protein n=1 Tax=Acrobeloides nanus TaxID=290746 RepID=A0A914D462_9BILA